VRSRLHQEVWEQLAHPQRKPEHTGQTSQNCLQTGMYATRVGSILKMGTRLSHAHMRGAKQTIRRGSLEEMHRHTSTQDGIRAPRECIRQNFRDFLQCGAEYKVATKFNHSVDVYANTPYPTQIINATTEVNDDDKTIVTSN